MNVESRIGLRTPSTIAVSALWVIVAMACASMPVRTGVVRRCLPVPPGSSAPPNAEEVSRLEGRYHLVMVDVFASPTAFDASESELQLWRPDSAMLAKSRAARPGSPKREDLRLLGLTWTMGSTVREPAEWDAGTLYLGYRQMLDAGPYELRIETADASGFRGTWKVDLGVVVRTDAKGNTLPPPAGHFCAVRIGG